MKKTMQFTWNEIKASRMFYVMGGYLLIFWRMNKDNNSDGLLFVLTLFLILMPLLAVANTAKSMQSNICRTFATTSLTRLGYLRSLFLIPLLITIFFFLLILGLGIYVSNADGTGTMSYLTDFYGMLILGLSLIFILVGFNTVFVLTVKALKFGADILAVVVANGLLVFFAPRLIAFLGFGRAFPETGVNSVENIRGTTNWLIYNIALVKTFSGFMAIAGVTGFLSFLLYKLGLRVFLKKDL